MYLEAYVHIACYHKKLVLEGRVHAATLPRRIFKAHEVVDDLDELHERIPQDHQRPLDPHRPFLAAEPHERRKRELATKNADGPLQREAHVVT